MNFSTIQDTTAISAKKVVSTKKIEPKADTPHTAETPSVRCSYAPFGTIGEDSLRMELLLQYPDTATTRPPYRLARVEEVMGADSELIAIPAPAAHRTAPFTSDGIFQGFFLVLVALYAMLLHYNMADIHALVERIGRNSAGSKHVFDEYRGSGFPRFMNTSGIIGLFFIGVLVIKYSDVLLGTQLSSAIPPIAAMPLSVAVSLAFCVVLIVQWMLLQAVGFVTLSRGFIAQLLQLRQLYFTLQNIIITPTLLLFVLCERGTGEIWFFLIVIELAITLLLYLREALNLFLSKKISILHWILYLCGVEIFPLSLLWLIVTR